MYNLKLNEQIAFLRKQKGMTQEELAKALGVTNQSVSKWESSHPDIQLLPELAKLFNVSVDELIGYRAVDTFSDIYLKIKGLFEETPKEKVFINAFRICILLHEAACTQGYKGYVPWDTYKNHGLDEETYKWGFSACSLPEGNTVHAGNGIFIADGYSYQSPKPSQVRDIYTSLQRLCRENVLKVLYSLYELTIKDFDLYVPLEDIAEKARLSKDEAQAAIDEIPITAKDTGTGQILYRIEGSYMHIPSLLLLIRKR